MKLGLHKPGQGYWVRVMTAAMIAVITFATAGWLMGQMSVLADKLPVHSWATEIGLVSAGQPQVGQRVKLLTAETATAPAELLGTAEVTMYDASGQTLKIGAFAPAKEGYEAMSAATFARTDDGAGFAAPVKGTLRKVPIIQAVYLQGIAAALTLLLGAIFAYYFTGVRQSSVEFLISTDMEMKKVNWSTRKDILNSTWVVVGASFLLAAVLFGIDIAFQQFFQWIGVLQ